MHSVSIEFRVLILSTVLAVQSIVLTLVITIVISATAYRLQHPSFTSHV